MTIPPSSQSFRPPPPAAVAPARAAEWLDPRFRRLLLMQMGFGYAYSALLLVPKFATEHLHASPSEVGELAAYPVVAAVVLAPFCGRWLDAGGFRSCLSFGAAMLALSTAAMTFVHNIGPAAYALRTLQGVGNALFVSGSASLVTHIVAREHHARAFGTVGAAGLLMNAVGSTATERLAHGFGWGIAFQVAAVIAFLAVVLSFGMPAVAVLDHGSADPANDRAGALRAQLGVSAGALAAGIGFGMLVTFTQPYALSLGAEHVASLFVGYTCTALFVRLGLGGAVDRWGRRRSAFVSLVLYALTALSASSLQPSWLFVLGLGFGVAHGIAWPSLFALAVEGAARGRVGSALTGMQASFGIGSVAAVWGGGHLVTALGYPTAFVLAATAITVFAMTLKLCVPPKAAA
jgi:MFS family permease